MKRRFVKMQGCGNDYIFFDCLTEPVTNPGELAVRLSDRHFSIGGDGIVLICPSERADAGMRMFNADGSEGRMCGNAARCVGRYLFERVGLRRERLTLETASGVRGMTVHEENGRVAGVTVDMGAPELSGRKIPVDADGEIIRYPLEVGGHHVEATCLSMGNPHCVIFTGDIHSPESERLLPLLERHPFFPERVNTELVRVIDRHALEMRVWERGSGETLACGTGACAAAVAASLCGYCARGETVDVRLHGGTLRVRWGDTVELEGPAEFAFEGEIDI